LGKMTGIVINVAAVVAGGTLGTLLGEGLPSRIRHIIMHGVGLVTLAVGMSVAITTKSFVLVLVSIIIGGILGEWWRLEERLDGAGKWLEAKASRFPFLARGEFTKGFVTASLVFCVGADDRPGFHSGRPLGRLHLAGRKERAGWLFFPGLRCFDGDGGDLCRHHGACLPGNSDPGSFSLPNYSH